MLSENEFWMQVERLASAFGERNFLPGRMRDIYPYVKPISPGEFVNIVSHLIDESPMPPTPAKIKEACRPLIDKARIRNQSIAAEQYGSAEAGHWCRFCGNTGVISADMREDFHA